MRTDWVSKIVGLIVCLFLLFLAIRPFMTPAAGMVDAVFIALEVALFGGLTGIAFCYFFLRDITDYLTDFLLYPRKMLKKPAPLISPIQGLIQQGKYELALTKIDQLLQENPDCTPLWSTRFELLKEYMKQTDAAMQTAETYFARKKREFAPQNMELLISYREIAYRINNLALSNEMIAAELKEHPLCYSSRERRQLQELLQSDAMPEEQ